jgi:hypothetical protein
MMVSIRSTESLHLLWGENEVAPESFEQTAPIILISSTLDVLKHRDCLPFARQLHA